MRQGVHHFTIRPFPFSLPPSFRQSIFTFHNESINIWSHLSGTVYVLYALSCFLRMDGLHVNIDDSEYKAILTFLLCAVACLSFSTCYHTFGCMSVRPPLPPSLPPSILPILVPSSSLISSF